MNILREEELPEWKQKYPHEYLVLIENGIVDFEPWQLLNEERARIRFAGLKERYPGRDLFAFAARGDCDDIACWEKEKGERVVIIHDFASPEYAGRREFPTFWNWFRQAIEDMIEFSSCV